MKLKKKYKFVVAADGGAASGKTTGAKIIAKKYGLTPKNSTNGKNIGTNIIKISVHSRGQPNKKIIICVIIKNCQGCRSIDLKKCSNTSWPPK